MEAHPVPQNVTSFEFHLIGDMTLKQFGYLAGGLGISYLLFVTLGDKAPLLVWPLILVFGLTGIAFAFLPISERPLDHWVGAFLKAIFLPTQRKWESKLIQKDSPQWQNRLQIYLSSLQSSAISRQAAVQKPVPTFQPTRTTTPLPKPQPGQLKPISSYTKPQTMPLASQPVQPTPKPLPSSEQLHQTVELAKKATQIQTNIVDTEKELETIKKEAASPGSDAKQFTTQFQNVMSELQNLTKEASEVQKELATLSGEKSEKIVPKIVVPTIKKSAPVNLSLTSTPNVINGIVTDTLNNYLEGVIVVCHDKQGLPVRALKTNKLGQFVAATPLPNGLYNLSLEKDNLNFGEIQIELTGKVLPPVVIAAQRGVIN